MIANAPRVEQSRAFQQTINGAVQKKHVLQRAWTGEEFPKPWDVLIDGVQWYIDEDGLLWYDARELPADHIFQDFAGSENKRTREAWERLRMQLETRQRMQARLGLYSQAKVDSLSNNRERRIYGETGDVSGIEGPTPTSVLRADGEEVVSKENWKTVEDNLNRFSPESPDNTKFFNLFHIPDEGGPVDAVVMMENFRERAQPFFASDKGYWSFPYSGDAYFQRTGHQIYNR